MTTYMQRKCTIQSESKEEDRLSELPEAIIIDIISLLPLRHAVATSVLSRRWHNLWTQIHSIDVRYSEFNNTPLHIRNNFFNIIHGVLKKLTSTSIQRFSFSIGSHFSYTLLSWFDQICCRNVKEIKAECDSTVLPLEPPLPLPALVFQTMSLVELDIGDGFWLPFPSNDDDWVVNFNLPRLKKLRFSVFRGDDNSLENLLSSCPLLEEFFIKLVHSRDASHDSVFNLSCHNLKILELEVYKIRVINLVTHQVYTTKFVLDVPKLEYFSVSAKLYEDLSITFVGNNPIALLRVRLKRIDLWNSFDLLKPSSNFLNTISQVTSLELDCIRLIPSIAFPNLTRLEMRWPLGNDDRKMLIGFLQCCPALEVLMLNIVNRLYHVQSLRWESSLASETPEPPPCLQLLPLTKMELKIEKRVGYGYGKELINMVRYLLQSFHVLEQFTFRIDKRDDGKIKGKSHIQSDDEWTVCEEIFSLPKRSSRCQINFVGECHKASSNNAC